MFALPAILNQGNKLILKFCSLDIDDPQFYRPNPIRVSVTKTDLKFCPLNIEDAQFFRPNPIIVPVTRTDLKFCSLNIDDVQFYQPIKYLDPLYIDLINYCPQDVSLFRAVSTSNVSYCPQNKLRLAITLATAPTLPTYVINTGQYWYDSTNSVMKYWDGSNWVLV